MALRDFRYKLLDQAFNADGKLPREMRLPNEQFGALLHELEEESKYYMYYRGQNTYFKCLGVLIYPEDGMAWRSQLTGSL